MGNELTASDLRWLHSLDLAISVCTRMEELGITKSELAERAGMRLSSLSRIITGEQNMTLSTIAKLERALDVRFDSGFRYGEDAEKVERSSISGRQMEDSKKGVPSLEREISDAWCLVSAVVPKRDESRQVDGRGTTLGVAS